MRAYYYTRMRCDSSAAQRSLCVLARTCSRTWPIGTGNFDVDINDLMSQFIRLIWTPFALPATILHLRQASFDIKRHENNIKSGIFNGANLLYVPD